MMEQIDWGSPWATFFLATLLSGLAGLARQFARRRKLNFCDVCAGAVYSAVWGLGISLLWYEQFRDNTYTLLGGCILAALAGTLSSREVLMWLRIGLKAVDMAAAATNGGRRKASTREDRNADIDQIPE